MTMDNLGLPLWTDEPALAKMIVRGAVVREVRLLGRRPFLGRAPGRGRERKPRRWFEALDCAVVTDPEVGLATCAVIGVIGERVFSRPRWAALYLVGVLAGHGIGEVFQPRQGGTSVAFAGVLGGLAAQALQPASRVPPRVQFWAALAIPLAVIDTASEDIHGLPLLAGFGLALFWRWRERADASCHDRAGDVVSRA
jgi:hypothetical protein